MAKGTSSKALRPVLYQLCRSGERFEVGDGPTDLTGVDAVILGRGEPGRSRTGRIYIDDPWMSSKHARLFFNAGEGAHFIEDMDSTNGVMQNGRLVGRERLTPGDILETGRTFWLFAEEPASLPLLSEPLEFGTWSTWTPRLASALKTLEESVESNAHIFITGPEGSGKGFLARTAHLMSGRAGRLIHLDCRERRPGRLVVDLFGGEGQSARLKEADLGTLFLENVDALPRELQERLADTLKKGGYIPDGKTRRVTCDVRVIASSSHRPEDDEARYKRRFLEVVGALRIDLPGLDERRADLGLLLDDFLARARGAQSLSRDACRAVFLHPWRHHVKAFARVVECAAVLALESGDDGERKGRIELAHLPLEVVGVNALQSLLPERGPETRPPSSQHAFADTGLPTAPPRPQERPPTGLLAAAFDDPELTSEVHHPDLPVRESDELLRKAAHEIRGMVDAFEDLGDTDPAQRRISQPSLPDRRGPGVRAIDPSANPGSGPSSFQERPPSAYHDLSSVERSYASAVDPDLIVDALRRARGNVSGASRYLGKPRALVLRWMREFGLNAEDYRAP
jgi:DNA-binding NtrC family response regulator